MIHIYFAKYKPPIIKVNNDNKYKNVIIKGKRDFKKQVVNCIKVLRKKFFSNVSDVGINLLGWK